MTVYQGTVIFFSSKLGYGFVAWTKNDEKQKDLFVHYSDLNVEGFKTVKKDQAVTFEIGQNHKGQDKAINVTPVK